MSLSRTPIAGIILVCGIALAAATFGLFNWRMLEERRLLEEHGISTAAHIQAVTVSHKACNSSVQINWKDAAAHSHTRQFMTCFGNRHPGEAIGIRYLPDHPETAMIADGEGGLPESQFRNGLLIGGIVAAIMSVVAVRLMIRRLQSRLNKVI